MTPRPLPHLIDQQPAQESIALKGSAVTELSVTVITPSSKTVPSAFNANPWLNPAAIIVIPVKPETWTGLVLFVVVPRCCPNSFPPIVHMVWSDLSAKLYFPLVAMSIMFVNPGKAKPGNYKRTQDVP